MAIDHGGRRQAGAEWGRDCGEWRFWPPRPRWRCPPAAVAANPRAARPRPGRWHRSRRHQRDDRGGLGYESVRQHHLVGQSDHVEQSRPADRAHQRLREGLPEHPRDPGLGAQRHRHQPGHPHHPDFRWVELSRRVHGRCHLARPVRGPSARRPALQLPAAAAIGTPLPPAWWLAPPTRARCTEPPSSRTRASSTTARICSAAAGLTPPTTWEQLMSEAQTLQKAGKVKYGYVWQGASYEGATCNFMEYVASAGGTVLNSSATKSVVNSPQTLKALTFMKSLVTSGVTPGGDLDVPGSPVDDRLLGRSGRLPSQLGLRLLDIPGGGLRSDRQGRGRTHAGVRRRSPHRATPTSVAGTCTSTRTARTRRLT